MPRIARLETFYGAAGVGGDSIIGNYKPLASEDLKMGRWGRCAKCGDMVYWALVQPPNEYRQRWVAFEDEDLTFCHFDSSSEKPSFKKNPNSTKMNAKNAPAKTAPFQKIPKQSNNWLVQKRKRLQMQK